MGIPLSGDGERTQAKNKGFSLLELLVAISITVVILALLLQILGFTSAQWKRTSDNAKAFEGARAAFDALTRSLSQATLATEYDYYNTARIARLAISDPVTLAAFTPDIYGRYSSLHFVSGKSLLPANHTHAVFFQAPLNYGLDDAANGLPASGTINATGFFIRYSDDTADRPPNVSTSTPTPRTRFRLMQYLQPTEKLDVYRDGSLSTWFLQDIEKSAHVLAENVVALVVLPKLPDEQGEAAGYLAPGYEYNSRVTWSSATQPVQMHQLPPVVRVIMVAIDESSALRSPTLGSTFKDLFKQPSELIANLDTVEKTLRDARANYRVFQTDVPVRSAKWSE